MKRPHQGEPVQIAARDWNQMLTTAEQSRQALFNLQTETPFTIRNPSIVKVRNRSGVRLDQCAIVGLREPVIFPHQNDREFLSHVALDAYRPKIFGRFGVLATPCETDAITTCIVNGIAACKIRVRSENEPNLFADADDRFDALSVNDQTGAAQVIWRAGGTGVQWALVRIGNTRLPLVLTGELIDDMFRSHLVSGVRLLPIPGILLSDIKALNTFRLAGDAGDRVAIYWDLSVQRWVIGQVSHKPQYVVETIELTGGSTGSYGSYGSSGGNCKDLKGKRRKIQVVYCDKESPLEEFLIGKVGGCNSQNSPSSSFGQILLEVPQ